MICGHTELLEYFKMVCYVILIYFLIKAHFRSRKIELIVKSNIFKHFGYLSETSSRDKEVQFN